MTDKMPPVVGSWVDAAPAACTLPTVDRPLRMAEFDEMFAAGTTSVSRIGPRVAQLELRPDPAVAARAADLTVRETQCCSFFTFALTATGGKLTLEVSTPEGQVSVLDALVDRVRAVVAATGPR
jgi:hypothetical protein